MLAVATVASAGILVAWFPVSSLLNQRSQLAAVSSQLSRIDQQNASLRHQAKSLRTPSTLGRIAQQQYDLVPPGEKAYQVLPPSGSAKSAGTLDPAGTGGTGRGSGTPSAGKAGTDGTATTTSGAPAGTSGSFFTRVLQTLEFWR